MWIETKPFFVNCKHMMSTLYLSLDMFCIFLYIFVALCFYRVRQGGGGGGLSRYFDGATQDNPEGAVVAMTSSCSAHKKLYSC